MKRTHLPSKKKSCFRIEANYKLSADDHTAITLNLSFLSFYYNVSNYILVTTSYVNAKPMNYTLYINVTFQDVHEHIQTEM